MERTQADRIYAAERALGYDGWLCGVEDGQQWLNELIHTRWWKRRSDVNEIRLTYGRLPRFPKPECTGRKEGTTGYIEISRGWLCEQYLIHEASHVLVWPTDHGPKFVWTLLDLTGYAFDDEMRRDLKRYMEDQEVKFR